MYACRPIVQLHYPILLSSWQPDILIPLRYLCLGFPGGSTLKNPPMEQEMWVWSLGGKDLLEEGLATYSSIFAGKIPLTMEPGRLWSIWGCKKLDMTEAPECAYTYTDTCVYSTIGLGLRKEVGCVFVPRACQYGSCSHQNQEEGSLGHHWEVLYKLGQWIPHQ